MRGGLRQIAVLAAVTFNLVMNGLAGAGLLFGVQTGAVSDSVPTGLTPATWAFSIWGLIFVGAALFALWQARPSFQGPRYDAVGGPFALANVLCGLWQVPWLLRLFGVAAVVLFAIVAALAWTYVRLDRMGPRGTERWAMAVPVALFLGWTTVAAAVNVTVALAAAGWASASPLWPVAVVVAVAAVGAWVLGRTADVAMALVFTWAFVAIWDGSADGDPALTAALAAGVVAFWGAVGLALRRGHHAWPTAHSLRPRG